jgi:hypothetical protein
MFGRNEVSDRDLLKSINQRLARTGTGSSSKVSVSVKQGNVTLTGSLQHAYQRDPIVKAITRVTGVRRVNDQMQHVVKKRVDHTQNVRIAEHTTVVESSAASDSADEDHPQPGILQLS